MQHNTSIFESIFNRNFSEPGSENFLKELTERHPYFSPAQFFLLQKTEANTELFEKQAVKTKVHGADKHHVDNDHKIVCRKEDETGRAPKKHPRSGAPITTRQ